VAAHPAGDRDTSGRRLRQFPTHPLQAVLGGTSLQGPKPRNDDAVSGRIPEADAEMHAKGVVMCIADGITTGANSWKAARMCVTQFAQDYYAAPESWAVADAAGRLIASMNAWLYSQNRSGNPEAEGQVTTFTALVARSTTLYVFHVGDTRCLRLRDGRVTALTEDHTAAFMGQRETLTRAMGIEPQLRVDLRQEPMQEGDVYLLSSDGLHGVLAPGQIAAILAAAPLDSQSDLEAAALRLCRAALEAGSDDNVSAILLRILKLPSETLTEAHHRLTARAIPPALRPGNRIDGYEVLQVLAATTRSHVYLVRQGNEARKLVLKAPSANFAGDLRYLDAFILEQWVGRRIRHPQIMRILPDADSQFLYSVAEWMEGERLRDWMDRTPHPSLAEVTGILRSVVAGVRVFHRMGMVHRDLKPENILLDAEGTARLIDFGSVQVAGFADVIAGQGDGVAEGTIDYTAPEIVAGRGATPQSDLFSLGAIAWEMLTGEVPFRLSDRVALPSAAADWTLRPLAASRPDLPDAADRALRRCLAFAAADRPPAMSEFLGDLETAARSRQMQAARAPLLDRGSARFWRNWALLSSALALALALAGLLLVRQL